MEEKLILFVNGLKREKEKGEKNHVRKTILLIGDWTDIELLKLISNP